MSVSKVISLYVRDPSDRIYSFALRGHLTKQSQQQQKEPKAPLKIKRNDNDLAPCYVRIEAPLGPPLISL
jgi:hypothetical protein